MVVERDAAEELEVLEGDEGEVEIKRPRDCGRLILETRISELKQGAPVTVPAGKKWEIGQAAVSGTSGINVTGFSKAGDGLRFTVSRSAGVGPEAIRLSIGLETLDDLLDDLLDLAEADSRAHGIEHGTPTAIEHLRARIQQQRSQH